MPPTMSFDAPSPGAFPQQSPSRGGHASPFGRFMSFEVLDPEVHSGRVTVPTALCTMTRGLRDFIDADGCPPPGTKPLTLCMLYQSRRCGAGERCMQVHVGRSFVESVRARAAATKACCARHANESVCAALQQAACVAVTAGDDAVVLYDTKDFGSTRLLTTIVRDTAAGSVPLVERERLCRLHLRGACKFGRECHNVHLCPNAQPTARAVRQEPSPTAAAAPPPSPIAVPAWMGAGAAVAGFMPPGPPPPPPMVLVHQ